MKTEPNGDVGGINKRVALIVGSTGIVGGSQATLLVEEGWTVYGLARNPGSVDGVIPVAADLLQLGSFALALKDVTPHTCLLLDMAPSKDGGRKCSSKREDDRQSLCRPAR
jgi:uncharacterized protein YbjT (DUF2867 family)